MHALVVALARADHARVHLKCVHPVYNRDTIYYAVVHRVVSATVTRVELTPRHELHFFFSYSDRESIS